MKKDEQNEILDELWDAVEPGEFRETIKEISHYITKDAQIKLMKVLLNGLSPNDCDLVEAVNDAIADYHK